MKLKTNPTAVAWEETGLQGPARKFAQSCWEVSDHPMLQVFLHISHMNRPVQQIMNESDRCPLWTERVGSVCSLFHLRSCHKDPGDHSSRGQSYKTEESHPLLECNGNEKATCTVLSCSWFVSYQCIAHNLL